jgi:glucose-1-phosphate thymidylyltransferase
MWGIVPAAGRGSRIQPLACSKELLPVCGRREGAFERPRAVSDYLMERLVAGGASKICVVISSGKSDILEYYGGSIYSAPLCYTVQEEPRGLCDAIFRALPVIDLREPVLVGLPDTIWFPADALASLPDEGLSFLLFPVDQPQYFDAVDAGDDGQVLEIQVKNPAPRSNWIWGAFKMSGSTFKELHDLWRGRQQRDEYIGTLVNAWLAEGGRALGVRKGSCYYDVGTMEGYVRTMRSLAGAGSDAASLGQASGTGQV